MKLQGIPVPEEELDNIRMRFALWMEAMDEIEAAVGEQMNDVDPVPPVYPHEEF